MIQRPWVQESRSQARAIPKSVSFTSPQLETRMLWGLTSRCTNPPSTALPAAARARHTPSPTYATAAALRGAPTLREGSNPERQVPSTSSRTSRNATVAQFQRLHQTYDILIVYRGKQPGFFPNALRGSGNDRNFEADQPSVAPKDPSGPIRAGIATASDAAEEFVHGLHHET